MMRRAAALLALVATAAAPATDDARRLDDARRAEAAAAGVARRLDAAARAQAAAAARAAAQARGIRRQIAAALVAIDAAETRVARSDRRLAAGRARLARVQQPAARLLAALQSLARRPSIALIAQPGSIDDLSHLQAAVAAALPIVRMRAEAVRVELAATRDLQATALSAAAALRKRQAELDRARRRLAAIEAGHRSRAQALGRDARGAADRALALGERARDLIDRMSDADTARATVADLMTLPPPRPRPLLPGTVPPPHPAGVYRLPVDGRLVTGFGEMSAAGVRSRGLTLAVPAGSAILAPAAGTIRYAGRFRSFGTIVIVDHGAHWSTLVTGLSATPLRPGNAVAAGAPIGTAGGDEPRITVELRRRGRPVDLLALAG